MSDYYVGEIRLFGGDYAPDGWATCSGQWLSVSTYQMLYSLLGTRYGGDGRATFGLPDLRGRVPIHFGQGTGLSNYILAQAGGTETVTLTEAQSPVHQHVFYASMDNATSETPHEHVLATLTAGTQFVVDTTGTNKLQMSPQAVAAQGGSQPHQNMMPTMALTYIIALNGVYPPQP